MFILTKEFFYAINILVPKWERDSNEDGNQWFVGRSPRKAEGSGTDLSGAPEGSVGM